MPGTQRIVDACAATADELAKTRTFVAALEEENVVLKERLAVEKRVTNVLSELNETRKAESDALRKAVDAKNETIAAKDAVIGTQETLVDTLKRKRSSPWKRLADVLIGAAVFAILK